MILPRRRFIELALGLGGVSTAPGPGWAQAPALAPAEDYPAVVAGTKLEFPRDHGAHPRYRIEWWYITAWVAPTDQPQQSMGVQITFFRVRTGHPLANPSRFSPAQLMFAHAAVADPARGRLVHLEQTARPGLGGAEFAEGDTQVQMGRWSLVRKPDDRYVARIGDRAIDLDLEFRPPGPPILQGNQGFSPKGPAAEQASHYYSRPWMRTRGKVNGRSVEGDAWFDHEWSSELLAPDAQGWDWAGLHLDDGRALMVFRIRDAQGGTLWTQHRWVSAEEVRTGRNAAAGDLQRDAPEVRFAVRRLWQSPRTGVRWPVELGITIGDFGFALQPLMDDQELDARGGTGVLYWEGAVRMRDAQGRAIGRGYLELTGYGERLRM
jgi:predicted secreted hydrolase